MALCYQLCTPHQEKATCAVRVCACICMCVCTCMSACECMCVHVCTCVSMCMHVCVCVAKKTSPCLVGTWDWPSCLMLTQAAAVTDVLLFRDSFGVFSTKT